MRSSFVLSAVFAAITPAILADQIPLLPTGDSCTINSGASGECMEVSTCRSQGGVPEAGMREDIYGAHGVDRIKGTVLEQQIFRCEAHCNLESIRTAMLILSQ